MKRFSFLRWLIDRAAGTYLSLALLALGGFGIAAAANPTSWTVHDVPDMTLNTRISATATTGIKINPPQLNGTNMIFPTTSGGILQVKQGTRTEQIYYSKATVDATTKVITLTGSVIRDVCWNGTTTFTSCSNGQIFTPGATVREVNDARLFNLSAHQDRPNAFTASGGVAFSGSGSFRLPVFASAAERDRQLPVPLNGMVVYVTADAVNYQYIGGAWTTFASGVTPSATESATGKAELATILDQISRLAAGDSGGPLVLQPKYLTSSGSIHGSGSSANYGRIPILNLNGALPATMGGLGQNNFSSGSVLIAQGSGAAISIPAGAANNVLLSNGRGWKSALSPGDKLLCAITADSSNVISASLSSYDKNCVVSSGSLALGDVLNWKAEVDQNGVAGDLVARVGTVKIVTATGGLLGQSNSRTNVDCFATVRAVGNQGQLQTSCSIFAHDGQTGNMVGSTSTPVASSLLTIDTATGQVLDFQAKKVSGGGSTNKLTQLFAKRSR